jgi:hypothetical protein
MRGWKTVATLAAAASLGVAAGVAGATPPSAKAAVAGPPTLPKTFPSDIILPDGRLREAFSTRLASGAVYELTYDVSSSNSYADAIGEMMGKRGWAVQQRGPFDNGNKAVSATKAGRRMTLIAEPHHDQATSALTLILVEP